MAVRFKAAASGSVSAVAAAEASAAREAGQRVYTPVLPKSSALASGIDTWALAIEAIEGSGWALAWWAIDPAGNARPVFRAVR